MILALHQGAPFSAMVKQDHLILPEIQQTQKQRFVFFRILKDSVNTFPQNGPTLRDQVPLCSKLPHYKIKKKKKQESLHRTQHYPLHTI